MRNPLGSTGWVIRSDGERGTRFAGTCFSFRDHYHLLTADHCVAEAKPGDITVSILTDKVERGLEVKRLTRHPTADLAILEIAHQLEIFDFFAGETPTYDWGIPVSAFGYPEDTGETGMEPTPRYFRGNIQRVFRHRSPLGYEYDAVELSFGAPAGLRGGPVSPQTDYAMVMGVVAENIESSTYLSTITEVREQDRTYSERIHSIINYAIAVRLDPLKAWLDEHVPYPGVYPKPRTRSARPPRKAS